MLYSLNIDYTLQYILILKRSLYTINLHINYTLNKYTLTLNIYTIHINNKTYTLQSKHNLYTTFHYYIH